jgi:DNA polymerase I-like protein with 3'-5' exonuclease and polymerase domains
MQSCLVNTVHDSVVIDVHPAEEEQVIRIIKDVNDNLIDIIKYYYDVTINVPMVLEAKIGNNWLDTKDVM